MSPVEIERLLQEGIASVKRGQKTRAAKLLMQVVNADENNEQAWFWLSMAVDKTEDKITALENTLALNPNNATAQANLKWLSSRAVTEKVPERKTAPLSEKIKASQPTPPPPANGGYAPVSPVDVEGALDDPYQCVYCGAPADRDLRRCPECGRNLMSKRAYTKKVSASIRTVAFSLILQTGVAMIEGIVVVIVSFQGRNGLIQYVYDTVHLQDLFGDYLSWATGWPPILMWAAGIRIVLFTALILALLWKITLAYYVTVGAMIADMVWTVFRWFNKFTGPVIAVLDILFALVTLALVFATDRDFAVNEERLLCLPQPHTKGGIEFNRLGHLYRQKGMWALAVRHWRLAVGAMPLRADFYKDLAVGYAQIGYYQRALGALAEARRQAPDDADMPQLARLIEEKKSKDPRPRG
ncbi:MAG: hypothetical protein HYZ49_15375 [Chloroflexi bacterium]|nr:hypothetical protein [Chloroflexota bacterium]